ncbi:hypothetical protein ACFL0W_06825, partial [Nanoarchaeota archaeon]
PVLDCNLTIDGSVNATDVASSSGAATNYSVADFNDGSYYWNVTCIDDASNTNSSETRSFSIDATAPVITDVSATSVSNDSATIIWTTDGSANSSVNYGTDTSLGSFAGQDDAETSHSVSLTSLTNSTLYYYNVTSCDDFGNCKTEGVYNFTTTAADDAIAPATVSNLANISQTNISIYWNWTNPEDVDFDYNILYLNGINIANTSNNYYNATGLLSGVYYNLTINTIDTSGNINYTNISDKARTAPILTNMVNTSIIDADGTIINTTITFTDADEDLIYNDTNLTHDVTDIETGYYTVNITPVGIVVENVVIYDALIQENVTDIISIDDSPEPTEHQHQQFDEMFSINPLLQNFSSINVTITASSTTLFKCSDYNFTERACNGVWIEYMNLTPGETYVIIIEAGDPGYGEINLTDALHLDQNYSFIDNAYDEVVNQSDGLSHNISEDDFLRATFSTNLSNGNMLIVGVKDPLNGSTYFQVYPVGVTNVTLGTSDIYISDTCGIDYCNQTLILDNITGPLDTIDIRVLDDNDSVTGVLEFDYLEDPPQTAPSFTVVTDDSSTLASPTSKDGNVTFSATATDTGPDSYWLLVCNTTGAPTATTDPPTCPGVQLCVSPLTASDSSTSCQYDTQGEPYNSSNVWYSYVCDDRASNTQQLCSAVENTNSPYYIENDSVAPYVTLNYPVDDYNTSDTGVNFNWTASNGGDPVLDCNLTIDGVVNASD